MTKKRRSETLRFQGMVLHVYESEVTPGWIVVDIDTGALQQPRFEHPNGTPKIRLMVNDSTEDLQVDGEWEKQT